MSKKVRDFLNVLIPEEHLWKIKLFKNWSQIIGTMSDKVAILQIKDSILFLSVSHPAWAQELFPFIPMLKQKINSYLEKDHIKAIRFKTSGLKRNYNHFKRAQPFEKRKRTKQDFALSTREQSSLNKVDDQELRTALHDFLVRSKDFQKKD